MRLHVIICDHACDRMSMDVYKKGLNEKQNSAYPYMWGCAVICWCWVCSPNLRACIVLQLSAHPAVCLSRQHQGTSLPGWEQWQRGMLRRSLSSTFDPNPPHANHISPHSKDWSIPAYHQMSPSRQNAHSPTVNLPLEDSVH